MAKEVPSGEERDSGLFAGALDLASRARCRGDIEAACFAFTQEQGATHFHLVSARPRKGGGASMAHQGRWLFDDCHNAPYEWVVAMVTDNSRCPLLSGFLRGETTPIEWNQAHFIEHGAASRWAQYARIGASEGVCVGSPRGDQSLTVLTIGGHAGILANSNLLPYSALFVTLISEAAELHLRHGLVSRGPGELSAKETDALALVAQGLTTTEAAEVSGVSQRVFERTLASARTKLDATTTPAAACRALSLGLFELP